MPHQSDGKGGLGRPTLRSCSWTFAQVLATGQWVRWVQVLLWLPHVL